MNNDLLYELRDGIARVTFNREKARNALTFEMYEGLARIAEEVAIDPAVRVMVIRGAGDRAFASGTDISQFLEYKNGEDGINYERRLDKVLSSLERCPKPVIAAISGACTGGGAAIAAVCDLRIGTKTTQVGVPVARTLGNCLSLASITRLASLIGVAKTAEMMLTAKLLSAEEARGSGFLNEVVDSAQALDVRVNELATTLAGHAPLTLRVTKEQVRRLRAAMIANLNDDDLVSLCYGSADFKEGVRAFVAKRAPQWSGK
ncbi:MAG: enoyl-CoA hydratase/isomerase family protein [Burkholderiales bacterium]